MRLVRVRAPQGKADEVARVAFRAGISQVAVHQQEVVKSNGPKETKDVVDVEAATPTAKTFIDALMSSPFYDPAEYSIAVRQPRSIASAVRPSKITRPLVEPTTDIFEELWQFSHITFGFVGRVLIASLLLAYGLVEGKILTIIAGLLFMPLLPLLLAMGFGAWTRTWCLAGQGLLAFLVATVLIGLGGVTVALVTTPPIKFNDFSSVPVSFLISLGVGIAAGLATADDVGRREMIGLAATAQIAILPAWFGISFVFGFSPLEASPHARRAVTFLMNVATIVAASLATYALLGMRGVALKRFTKKP
jgi:hypothetical protein